MNDPLLVRRFERLGDLPGDEEGLVDRNRPARDPIGERRALDQLHHQGADAIGFFEPVDLGDVPMIERGEHLRLPLETRQALGIAGNGWRQDFDRDQAIQRCIAGFVDLAHAARADSGRDLIRTNAPALERCHALAVGTGARRLIVATRGAYYRGGRPSRRVGDDH